MKLYNWNTFRPKQRLPTKPSKNLTYPQARKKYGTLLSPFGDWDKDYRVNMYDCRPFNPFMHKVPADKKDRKVMSYAKPDATWNDVWNFVEREIPHAYLKDEEDYYSRLMESALLSREATYERVKELPFKDIVGIYRRGKVQLDVDQTELVQHYILAFLKEIHPHKAFQFLPDDPSKINCQDYETGKLEEGQKVTRYFPKDTKPWIRNLLTLLSPYTNITIVITDFPGEVARKSSVVTQRDEDEEYTYPEYRLAYTSCETPARHLYDGQRTYDAHTGPYSDIMFGNAIAWFYLGDSIEGKTPIGRVMLRWGTTDGTWNGQKGVGIEFYPEDKFVPVEMKRVWSDSPNKPRGFYGSISPGTARALIGEVQDILKEKGLYSKKVKTPYKYEGFSDLLFNQGVNIHYAPIERQRAIRSGNVFDIKERFLDKEKLQQPFMFALGEDPDTWVRQRIAERGDIPDPLKIQLAKDTAVDVRSSLAGNPAVLPKEAIDYMYSGGGEHVFEKLIFRKETPFPMKRGIISKSLTYPLRLAHELSIDSDTRKLLLNHKDFRVRREFAKRGDLTQGEIQQLLDDTSGRVLVNILSNPLIKITDEQFKKLVRSNQKIVRNVLTVRKDIPDEQLLILAQDKEFEVRLNIAYRSIIPPKTLEYILENYPITDIPQRIFETQFIPHALVQKLIQRPDIFESDYKMNYLFTNNSLTEESKAWILEKWIRTKGKVSSSLLDKYMKYKGVADAVMELIRNSSTPDKYLLRDMAHLTTIPPQYRNEIFALMFEYGGDDARRDLLKNPTVNREIKNIIAQNRGYY